MGPKGHTPDGRGTAMTIADLPVWPGCLDEDLRGKPLTAREQEVLGLVAEGMPNRIIARHLGISENTVKNHLRAVFAKLDVADRTQAALLAVRTGLAA